MASTFTITASPTVTLTVQRTNLVANPAATSSAGWNFQPGTGGADTVSSLTGQTAPTVGGPTTCQRATWTTSATGVNPYLYYGAPSSSTLVPITGGATYTTSMFVRCSKAQTLAGSIQFYGANNALVSGGTVVGPAVTLTAGVWARLSVTANAPATATHAIVLSTYVGGATVSMSAGDTLDVTGLLVEQAASLGSFFDGDTASTSTAVYAWTGAANGSTSTQSLAAVDPAVVPSVKIVVTQSGTPALSSVTVNRTDSAGNTFPVRTSDGDVLTISGGTGTVFDYEAPYGQTLTYTVAANNNPAATASLSVTQAWLVHLGHPKWSVPLDFPSGAATSLTRAIPQATYPILGSALPIVISGGARIAPAQTLTVQVQTPADLTAQRTALSDGCPLLLNVPSSLGLGLDSAYIAVGAVTEKRATPLGTDPLRLVELPYQVIGRPFGPAQAAVIWSDLTAASWSALPATTWAQMATP